MTWEPKNKTEDDDDGMMSDDEKEKDSSGGGGLGDGAKPLQQQQGSSSDTFGKPRHLICSWDIDPRPLPLPIPHKAALDVAHILLYICFDCFVNRLLQ